MKTLKSMLHGGANDSIRAGGLVLFVSVLLLPSLALALDPPDPLNVLFVANGYYDQEDDLEDHFLDLGCTVTKIKDYKVKGTTNLAPYDLIVVTEFAPGIPSTGINNIKASGKPVLIIEYWDFWYSYRFGLTTTDDCGYLGTDYIETVDPAESERLFGAYEEEVNVYQSTYTVYGIERSDLKAGVTPVYFSSSSFDEVAVLYDEARSILATGVYDTTRYTTQSWMLFDRFVSELTKPVAPWTNDGELWEAYETSGLRGFLDEVRRAPQNHTAQEIADTVWRKTLTWQLEPLAGFVIAELTCEPCMAAASLLGPFYFVFLTTPSGGADHLVRRTRDPLLTVITPEDCGDTANTEYCSEDYWFMGRNRGAGYDDYVSYTFEEVVRGTDLGISVQFGEGGRTFFYMGDTSDMEIAEEGPWGTPSLKYCAQNNFFACNDAIAVSYHSTESNDIDETDGIDARVYFEYFFDGAEYVPGFRPLLVAGVNRNKDNINDLDPLTAYCDTDPAPCLGDFNAPTGAAFVEWRMETPDATAVPTIALWYATGSNIYGKSTSWLAFSRNGIDFGALGAYPMESPYGVFSSDKFIQVSPVTITSEDLYDLCTDPATEDSILCDLPHLSDPMEAGNEGLLLFGAGQRYRCSPLYLAFMTVPRLNVWYYRNVDGQISWVTDESLATSISSISEAQCDANCEYHDLTDTWVYDGDTDDQAQVFGELSVKLVKGATPGEHYLVMLSNHNGLDRVQYRTAALFEPDAFSAPQQTTARGYGPYIVDAYTEVEDGYLKMYHLISAWNGKWENNDFGLGEPYGVYSRPVELEATFDFPEWPPQGN